MNREMTKGANQHCQMKLKDSVGSLSHFHQQLDKNTVAQVSAFAIIWTLSLIFAEENLTKHKRNLWKVSWREAFSENFSTVETFKNC